MPKNLNTKMLKVGVIGGTGYTGIELLRLLVEHPQVNIEVVTSRAEQGLAVTDVMPGLRGCIELNYSAPDSDEIFDCDMVFFATPNATAMYRGRQQLQAIYDEIDKLEKTEVKLRNFATYEEHPCASTRETRGCQVGGRRQISESENLVWLSDKQSTIAIRDRHAFYWFKLF